MLHRASCVKCLNTSMAQKLRAMFALVGIWLLLGATMFCVCSHLSPRRSSLLPMTSLLGTACPPCFRQAWWFRSAFCGRRPPPQLGAPWQDAPMMLTTCFSAVTQPVGGSGVPPRLWKAVSSRTCPSALTPLRWRCWSRSRGFSWSCFGSRMGCPCHLGLALDSAGPPRRRAGRRQGAAPVEARLRKERVYPAAGARRLHASSVSLPGGCACPTPGRCCS